MDFMTTLENMKLKYYEENVPDNIKSLSKEALATILCLLSDRVKQIKSKRKFTSGHSYPKPIDGNDVISTLYCALEEFERMDSWDDLREDLRLAEEAAGSVTNHIYVIKFADNTVKIGKSKQPERRIEVLSGGNKSKMVNSWVSVPLLNHSKAEKAVHKKFKDSRMGGEFFSARFEDVIEWATAYINMNNN